MRAAGHAVLAMLVGCGAPAAAPVAIADLERPAPAAVRHFTLWWHGARIGSAVETERWTAGGVHLERHERVVLRRGEQLVATELVIAIDADPALRATRIVVEQRDGAALTIARAERAGGGWRIDVPGEPIREAPAAEPAELVPLRVRRDRGFAGRVLLPGRGFAVADGRVTRDGDGRYRATVTTAHGALEATLTVDRDGDALVVAGADGVVARRASAVEVARGFAPPEAIAAGALSIAGEPPLDSASPLHLRLAPVARPLPPALPAQRVAAAGDAWRVDLDRALPAALPPGRGAGTLAAIDALVRAVAVDIRDDLASTAAIDPRDAIAGDCTTHARAFAARAADAGIDTRLVTGFRIDGVGLVRHRWALAWTGAAWIAVDPTFGEAPAAPRLLGLAVHGSTAAELALADAAFSGIEGAAATIAPASAGRSR